MSLLSLYDRPTVSRWMTPATLVIAALVVRYLTVGYRLVGTAVMHIPDELVVAPWVSYGTWRCH